MFKLTCTSSASSIDDPLERFIAVVRYYLSGWHIKPKVCRRDTRWNEVAKHGWMNRVSRSHTILFLGNTLDVATSTRMALKPTTLLNRCRIILQCPPTTIVRLNTMLSYVVIFVPNLVSLAIALLLLCKVFPTLYLLIDTMNAMRFSCQTCMLVAFCKYTAAFSMTTWEN